MFFLANSGDILRQAQNNFISVIDNTSFGSITASGLRIPANNGTPIHGVLVKQLKPMTGILTIEHIHNLCWLTNGHWELANELISLEDAVNIRKQFFDVSHKAKPSNFNFQEALELFDVGTL